MFGLMKEGQMEHILNPTVITKEINVFSEIPKNEAYQQYQNENYRENVIYVSFGPCGMDRKQRRKLDVRKYGLTIKRSETQ